MDMELIKKIQITPARMVFMRVLSDGPATWKDLKDSLEDLSVKRKSLEATEERAKITKAQYEKGIVSFDDWVIIENSLALSRKSYLSAQADMLVAEAYCG